MKVITVRTTAFDAAQNDGNAEVVDLQESHNLGISEFIKEEIAESDRPELTSADVIISGG